MLFAMMIALGGNTLSERLDVLVDLKGKGEQAHEVAAVVGHRGRVVRLEPSGVYRVELRGQLDETLAALRFHARVANLRPVAPELATDILDTNSLAKMSGAIDLYKAKYRAFEERSGAKRDEEEERETPGLDYLEAHRFYLEERAYPNDEPDWPAWARAAQHRDAMPAWNDGPSAQGLVGTWSYLGPTNLDTPYRIYYGLPPLNGRVNGVAYHPTDANTFYLVGAQGGVWKTTDGGVNYTPLSDKWEVMAASSVAVDPTNPNVIYVGTGDYPGSKPYCMGIMKSTDGGATWTNYGRSQFGTRAINKILLDPANPQIVLVTTGRGAGGNGFVWRSTDGGITWSSVITTSASWSDLTVGAPSGGQRYIYAAGGDTAGGKIFRSQNQGATWTAIASPVTGTQSGLCISASVVDPNTVYLLTPSSRNIWKSTNAGASWTNVSAGFVNGTNNYNWSQGSYDFFMATSKTPANADVIYVGLIDVVQSINGGASWQSVGGPAYSNSSIVHNDQHCIAINPLNPNQALVGGDGGIFRFTYTPASNTWAWNYLSRNLGITQFYRMAAHPTNPNILLGGTQDNATPFCNGALGTWDNVGGGDGGYCEINPTSPGRQYSESQYLNIYKTTNSWGSSSGIGPSYGTDSVAFIAPFVLDPNNPNLLYAGTNYLYRYTDSTNTWATRLGATALTTGTIRAIAVAPGDSNRIYTGASDGQVWMSSNAGTSWTQINTGSPSLPNRTITSISINPANKDDILITVSGTGTGHVYRCINTLAVTRVWQNLSGSLATGLPDVPVNSLARDLTNPQTMWYAATDVGVFATGDGGATWANATAPMGLPNTQVNDLKAVPGTGRLVAATYGRGMWSIQLSNLQNVTGTIELQDYLPPTMPRTVTLEFRTPGTTTVVHSVNLAIGGGGPKDFVTGVSFVGTYDVAAKGSNWLRKVLPNVVITPIGASNLAFSLRNGDSDGDNEVGIGDYALLSASYGKSLGDPGYAVAADLNGDDTVDIADYAILSSNYGMLGDN
ncbi:MAG: hypothetical protein K1X67_24865 [Fimbriimonadaceae bacterium]|nr:hypothetical protein [Fimbriimonadaceae bacterium]